MSQPIEVLVLDDEEIVGERLRDYLQKRGMSVETFTVPQEALDRLAEKTFDVVVTDMKMEGQSGMDVLLAVKGASYRSEVIIITAYGLLETLREAEVVGVFCYLPKPFKMSNIYTLIKQAASKARMPSN